MRWAVVVTIAVLVTAVGLVLTGPWSSAVLASPSMAPAASPGDLLLHRHVPAEAVNIGDVITVRRGDGRLVTHRVVRLLDAEDARTVQLQGDRSPLPDPGFVELPSEVARVAVVVPLLGSVLTVGGPAVATAVALLVLGGVALVLAGRHAPSPEVAPATAAPRRGRDVIDPRIEALLATCEQFVEDGMPPAVATDVVRVRTAAITGLPPAERSGAVLDLDDGSRFYVVACADADVAALSLVPVASDRRRRATAALDQWWEVVASRLDPRVDAAVRPWTMAD